MRHSQSRRRHPGYVHQPLSLLFGQITQEGDFHFDLVNHPVFSIAISTIVGMDSGVGQADADVFERPFLWSAYIRTVMLVQAPRAARSNSYGFGPASLPPRSLGSSA